MISNIAIFSGQSAIRVPRKQIERLVAFVAKEESVRFAEVGLSVVNAKEMAGHNRRFLNHTGPTDVISFDLTDKEDRLELDKNRAGRSGAARRGGLSAQLIVCGDIAAKQGPLHGNTPTHELLLYIIHGLLHVIGYDDTDVRAGAKMHAREEELLRKLLIVESKRRTTARR